MRVVPAPRAPAHGLDVKPRSAWATTRPPVCRTCQNMKAAQWQSGHFKEVRKMHHQKSSGLGSGMELAPPESHGTTAEHAPEAA